MPPRVKLFYNRKTAEHTHAWAHVEKNTRAADAYEHLNRAGLLSQIQVHPGHSATDSELLTVHTPRHLEEVRRMSEQAGADPTNRRMSEPDGPGGVYYSSAADSAARFACGCVIDAACSVLKDSQRSGVRAPPAFALVRPPGHHAGADDAEGHHAEGFCFYNSIAVAARVALASSSSVAKVAILDWDVHQSDGRDRTGGRARDGPLRAASPPSCTLPLPAPPSIHARPCTHTAFCRNP